MRCKWFKSKQNSCLLETHWQQFFKWISQKWEFNSRRLGEKACLLHEPSHSNGKHHKDKLIQNLGYKCRTWKTFGYAQALLKVYYQSTPNPFICSVPLPTSLYFKTVTICYSVESTSPGSEVESDADLGNSLVVQWLGLSLPRVQVQSQIRELRPWDAGSCEAWTPTPLHSQNIHLAAVLKVDYRKSKVRILTVTKVPDESGLDQVGSAEGSNKYISWNWSW